MQFALISLTLSIFLVGCAKTREINKAPRATKVAPSEPNPSPPSVPSAPTPPEAPSRPSEEKIAKTPTAPCGSQRPPTESELAAKLETVANLRATTDSAPLNRDLAFYLIAYFQIMGVRFSEAVDFSIVKDLDERYVRRDKRRLLFSSEKLEGVLPKVLDSINRDHLKAFDQLIEETTDSKSTAQLLKNQFEINIGANADEDEINNAREMSDREASAIFLQILSIPTWLTRDMKIKNVVRIKSEAEKKATATDYRKSTQTIKLSDAAFDPSGRQGKSTFLHELGYAYWAKILDTDRERFTELSWAGPKGAKKLKPESTNFVLLNSVEDPRDDFAEHFSVYFNLPDLIYREAPDKYRFFQTLIFADSSSMSAADKKLTMSLKPDKANWISQFHAYYIKLVLRSAMMLRDKNEIDLACVEKELPKDINGRKKTTIAFPQHNRPVILKP